MSAEVQVTPEDEARFEVGAGIFADRLFKPGSQDHTRVFFAFKAGARHELRHRTSAQAESARLIALAVEALGSTLKELWDDCHSRMNRDTFEANFESELATLAALRAQAPAEIGEK